MEAIEIDHEEKRACSNDRFCSFVANHDDFTFEETSYLQTTILNKKLSKILYVSATLAIWSMTAAWVDVIILPVLIVYAISLPGAVYYPILFPIVWTILNGTFKFIYIRQRLGDAVTLRDALLAIFPYAGAAFLLKNWFVGDPLLRNASMAYISHQKKRTTQKLFGFLKRR